MEQLYVFICEQSEALHQPLYQALTAYAIRENVEVEIKWMLPRATEREVSAAAAPAQLALIHADDGSRAAALGRLLRRENPDCAILFYGTQLPQATDALVAYFAALIAAKPARYLYRPTQQEFYHAVEATVLSRRAEASFCWQTKAMRYQIPYRMLLYFRSERNYVYARLRNGSEYSFLGKLSTIEPMLPKGLFVRIHQSYLVNRGEITAVDKRVKAVHLSTGEALYISKAHYKDVLS